MNLRFPASLAGICLAWAFVVLSAVSAGAGDEPRDKAPDQRGVEFFEKRIRPLLAEHCYACHGASKQKAGLRLDRPAFLRKGGDRGPPLVPGNADASLLIQAVRYTDQDLSMPPKGKLKEEAIADLVEWVRMGAPMPEEVADGTLPSTSAFDLAERRRHWAYEPVQRPPIPAVADLAWCRNPIDAFIRSRQEAAGLRPAPEADRRVLIRRLTFDLIGLPPTPAEIQHFLEDDEPGAYERLVDRLLASPHYGERWGRHWLDLVRYAETLGHEFDYDIHHAWRYRDYVIGAFNDDLPYDRFVIEHLAGDLVQPPRRDPVTGHNLSVIGTAWFWLGEEKHSPVDARQQEADRIDNQLDVFGKAFLAQTISCARCHDHKFDAISTEDYYALAGYLKSSRYQQAFLDPPEAVRSAAQRLSEGKQALRSLLIRRVEEDLAVLPRYLSAVRRHLEAPEQRPVAALAEAEQLDPSTLDRWVRLLHDAGKKPQHPLFALAHILRPQSPDAQAAWSKLRQGLQDPDLNREQDHARLYTTLADFRRDSTKGWFVRGPAFGDAPVRPGDVVVTPSGQLRVLPAGTLHSGHLAPAFEGVLQSPTFRLEKRYLMFEVGGRGGRVNIVVDGLNIIRDPIYGPLTFEVKDETLHWRIVDVNMWLGKRAYVEFADSSTPGPSYPMDPKAAAGLPADGYIAVRRVLLSDQAQPPATDESLVSRTLLAEEVPSTLERFDQRLQERLQEELKNWKSDHRSSKIGTLLECLINEGLLGSRAEADAEGLIRSYVTTAASIPGPTRAPAMADGTGEDEQVFLRGNYKTPGPVVPRRLPLVLEPGTPPRAGPEGSGRLELAVRLVSPSNPLVARVLVNRLWQHHFGVGLVPTPDDFGRMGERPTHPELLDYLAWEFVNSGWSLKAMHRLIVTSSTYRMSGQAQDHALTKDPQNRLWHHRPIRRLEAEAIRDSLLAVAGRLDRRMGGPGIAPFLTPHMEGRGRPAASGPVDGAGRRSVYLAIRRNFLPPLFLAYDFPIPFTTVGRRTVSNVPAQALILMNDPLVREMAQSWASRAWTEVPGDPAARIRFLYLTAFGRPPTPEETDSALAFLAEQAQSPTDSATERAGWVHLCHVLFNAKEFIFVE